MDTRFTGYAVCDDARIVVPFESAHKDRRGVADAVKKAVESDWGFQCGFTCEVFRADSQDGESYMERAEFAARDSVSGCYGEDSGYALQPAIEVEPKRGASVVTELHQAFGTSRALLDRLLESYMKVTGAHDESEISGAFGAGVEAMAAYFA